MHPPAHRPRTLDKVRASALKLQRSRKGTRGLVWFGLVLVGLLALGIGSANPFTGLGLFVLLGGAIALGGRRSVASDARAADLVGIPEPVRTQVAAMPPTLPEPVHWRLDRALHAVHHMSSLLEHAPFGSDLPDVTALRRDAQTCLERVVDRCEALIDLCAVQGPSDTILAARKSVQREIDDHLVSLNGAMDAVASYVAVGTSDAVQTLRDRAHQLHAIAGGLRELEAPSTVALPPAQSPS